MTEIPPFDELLQLAETDPSRFEVLKAQLIDEQIRHAPSHLQPRLRSVQFQAEIKTRHSTNPISRCVILSGLMHDALASLGDIIRSPSSSLGNGSNIYPLGPVR
ncbi:DUF3135 domain-containing protein [Aestuariirhabdus sp. LZHN29]|uniref:DUF3135 domain-containing protein n=1 Tax=Aestuariirhabdus sp. LZHN29 TaxID=3417462 RepID=UPI003CEC55C3